MEAIFRTYPAVRQKHRETVPHKYTEAQFWTKFFQSHYFHRDRINAGTKDLFTDCAKIDDQGKLYAENNSFLVQRYQKKCKLFLRLAYDFFLVSPYDFMTKPAYLLYVSVLSREMSEGVSDPLVDVTSFEDNTLAEGYGNSLENSKTPTQNIVHQSMIKR